MVFNEVFKGIMSFLRVRFGQQDKTLDGVQYAHQNGKLVCVPLKLDWVLPSTVLF